MFVLIMQFTWLYIDEIMGKGIGTLELIELIYYLSCTMIPTALPIASLISSVMVMGNLAERYELSTFKSAGVPLIRVMIPIIILGFGISLFSLFCSDRLIPWANLKFHSRFYDIRKQKPTLAIVPGVFLDNFAGYTLRIGKKDLDNKTIHDVLIYDNKNTASNQVNEIIAKHGQMYNTPDKQYIVMDLNEGTQYQELSKKDGTKSYQFVRTKFKSWQKLFDLAQLEQGKTDESLFKSHQKMLSSVQLNNTIDSIKDNALIRLEEQVRITNNHFYPKIDTVALKNKQNEETRNQAIINQTVSNIQKSKFRQSAPEPSKELILNFYVIKDKLKPYDYQSLINKAESNIRTMQSTVNSSARTQEFVDEQLSHYYYELHLKFAFALVCMIFIFIGAPMGAIVQKGGFGFPILISIMFFMLFISLYTQFQNLSKSQSVNPILAAWMPVIVLAPIGILITYRAMNDYKILQFDVYIKSVQTFIIQLFHKISRKKTNVTLDK
jgi:lipopolysaccharide export system permease protein